MDYKNDWRYGDEEKPPTKIDLLVKSPKGEYYIAQYRETYNIFTCQVKSESIDKWKWKIIEEPNSVLKVTEVDFNMGGEGRNALYINGGKIKEGDHYHDKISVFIEGFVFALKTMGIDYEYKKMIASKNNKVAFGIYENFDAIPDQLQEFDKPTKKI